MDPMLRDNAVIGPTSCAFCGTFGTAVIDTGIDLLGHGRINICTRLTDDGQVGCAEIIGRLGGNLVDRGELDDALHGRRELEEECNALAARLTAAEEITREAADKIVDAVKKSLTGKKPAAKTK